MYRQFKSYLTVNAINFFVCMLKQEMFDGVAAQQHYYTVLPQQAVSCSQVTKAQP